MILTIKQYHRFVNAERIPQYFERLGIEVNVKIHTNTIEGAWGNLKPKLRVKRGIRIRGSNGEPVGKPSLALWCHFYSF